MLIFVIGPSDSGKSTIIAPQISEALESTGVEHVIVEAGGWVRASLPANADAEALTNYAMARLADDPDTAIRWVREKIGDSKVAIVAGIRNPFDFIKLFRPKRDRVVFVHGNAKTNFERYGIDAILRNCIWAASSGIMSMPCELHSARGFHVKVPDNVIADIVKSATAISGTIVPLPIPIRVTVDESWLRGFEGSGEIDADLVALESYEGADITAMIRARSGGTFHDLPLETLRVSRTVGALESLPRRACYSVSGKGPMVVESGPSLSACTVFDEKRIKIGTGISRLIVHWPKDNLLMHLVAAGDRLLLVPPHKLLFIGNSEGLPKWSKLKAPTSMPPDYHLISMGKWFLWERSDADKSLIPKFKSSVKFSSDSDAILDAHRDHAWRKR